LEGEKRRKNQLKKGLDDTLIKSGPPCAWVLGKKDETKKRGWSASWGTRAQRKGKEE